MVYQLEPTGRASFSVRLNGVEAATLYFDAAAADGPEWALTANVEWFRTEPQLPRPFRRFTHTFETLAVACAFLGVAEPPPLSPFSAAEIGTLLIEALHAVRAPLDLTPAQRDAIGRLLIERLRPDLSFHPDQQVAA
ncbi:hypothetical protein [Methylobacterium organophilum]|uniref:Uncharacterized protein n=1 Tax=Methylobacterium organophilum TaxID=410 RepID=A0ABQ4T3Q6_METOR|nr:hypothetical protein [Methylobacterium organophilum]GJE26265.1 hypothetical protein LKMONMHP_1114 [Methylobacterium organophilum]